jgi:hypothetical protein
VQKLQEVQGAGRERPLHDVCKDGQGLSLSFDLPLPTNRLRANFRGHSRQKAGAVSAAAMLARETAKAVLAGSPPPHWSRVRIEYVFHFRARNQMQDSDNAVFACKPYLDGLKDWIMPPAHRRMGEQVILDPGIPGAGIITDDKGAWPLSADFRINRAYPHVTITLTPY